ncbi:hypothetical protein VTN02DRAFT_4605 [Thermoascus thermophilus]
MMPERQHGVAPMWLKDVAGSPRVLGAPPRLIRIRRDRSRKGPNTQHRTGLDGHGAVTSGTSKASDEIGRWPPLGPRRRHASLLHGVPGRDGEGLWLWPTALAGVGVDDYGGRLRILRSAPPLQPSSFAPLSILQVQTSSKAQLLAVSALTSVTSTLFLTNYHHSLLLQTFVSTTP